MVDYVGVATLGKLLKAVGVEPFLLGLADRIEVDFRRWPSFDKAPRYVTHSPGGVVELMPTSDGQRFGFK